jgi:ABC-type transport system involved in cytochrome bd biosynthesis fused ATPase/permease subunit
MNLRDYLLSMLFGTLAALAAVIIVLIMIDPASAGLLAFASLYITLGAAAVGCFTIVGTLVRVRRQEAGADVGQAVARSLRQAIFFAILLLISLFLSSRDLLTVWTVILLIILVTLVEFFFLAGKREA